MKRKFKLQKPLPKSWGVLNDGSKEFKDWVVAYMNTFSGVDFGGGANGWLYGRDKNGQIDFSFRDDFSTILTLKEFKSHFKTK